MSNVTIIDGLEFVEFEYAIKAPVPCISVTVKGNISIGKRVKETLGSVVRLMWTKDGAKVAVTNADGAHKGLTVGNAGTAHAKTIAETLVNIGVSLPAKYAMTQRDGDLWVGELLPFEPAKSADPATPKPDTAAQKPRKQGLAAMMPKGVAP